MAGETLSSWTTIGGSANAGCSDPGLQREAHRRQALRETPIAGPDGRDRPPIRSSADDQGAVHLHYEPQVRGEGEVVGFEALIPPRINDPVAANDAGVAAVERLLRAACGEAARWQQSVTVAVRLTESALWHADCCGVVEAVLRDTGLDPGRLELGVADGSLPPDCDRGATTLRRLHALGVRLSMVDFGAGHASVTCLRVLPFSAVRIDQGFVSRLGEDARCGQMVRAIIGLSRGLALSVAAEGVETKGQRRFLLGHDCDLQQGPLYGLAAPIEAYRAIVDPSPRHAMPAATGRAATRRLAAAARR